MSNVYIMDNFERDEILDMLDNADNIDDLKDIIRKLLQVLPVEINY